MLCVRSARNRQRRSTSPGATRSNVTPNVRIASCRAKLERTRCSKSEVPSVGSSRAVQTALRRLARKAHLPPTHPSTAAMAIRRPYIIHACGVVECPRPRTSATRLRTSPKAFNAISGKAMTAAPAHAATNASPPQRRTAHPPREQSNDTCTQHESVRRHPRWCHRRKMRRPPLSN